MGCLFQVQLGICSFLSGKTPLLDLDEVYTKSSSESVVFAQAKLHF